MRVLLAYDGSNGATQAADIVASAAWPEDSLIRVVSVIEPVVMPMHRPWADDAIDAVTALAGDRNAEVVMRLKGSQPSVEGTVLRGRPATVIIDEARTFAADLIVMGSRGQGLIASLLLGSVSAEVIDHVRCPILVARAPTIKQVVLATDESSSARAAESIVAEWSMFEALPIRVVSVAHVDHPWTTGIAPTMYRQVVAAYAADLRDAKATHKRAAEEAADRLRGAGRRAEPEMREGDPAAEIIAVAEERGADLIVLGSRGRTGVARLLLGSVARNVLSGTTGSVLIVHERTAEEA
jgi:nucleotide-binding universal stress UspA family protein